MTGSDMAAKNDSTYRRNSQPMVIFADCDIDQAVRYTHQSLRHEALTVHILVEENIHQIFVESLLDSLEEASQQPRDWNRITPSLPSMSKLRHVRELLKAAKGDGATLATGAIPSGSDIVSGVSYCRNPTVVDHVRPDMKLFGESVTGPLATISGFSDTKDAITWLNDDLASRGAVVFSSNTGKAWEFLSEVASGPLSVNAADEPRV